MAMQNRRERVEKSIFADYFRTNLDGNPPFEEDNATVEFVCSRMEVGSGRGKTSKSIAGCGHAFMTTDVASRFGVDFVDFKSTEDEEIVDYISSGPSSQSSCSSSNSSSCDSKSFGSCEDLDSDDADSAYSGESNDVRYSPSPVSTSSFDSFPNVEHPNVNSVTVPCSLHSYTEEHSRVDEANNGAEDSDAESLPFEEEAGGELGAFDCEFMPCLFGGRRENVSSWSNSSLLQIKLDGPRFSHFDSVRDKEAGRQKVIDDIVSRTMETTSSCDYKDLETSVKLTSEGVEKIGVRDIHFDPKNFPGVIKVDRSLIDLKNKRLKYKTDLCRHHLLTGKCTFGDNCTYAHGMDELRKKIVPLEYKTRVCKDYQDGVCEYGYKCTFAHVSG